MTIKIGNHIIGQNHPPFIIAELSANHNGSLERALKTMDEAKRCGAHAIKLQTYTAETMTINCDLPDFLIKGGCGMDINYMIYINGLKHLMSGIK